MSNDFLNKPLTVWLYIVLIVSTALKSLSSRFTAVQLDARPAVAAALSLLLAARCSLAGLQGFLDVWLH